MPLPDRSVEMAKEMVASSMWDIAVIVQVGDMFYHFTRNGSPRPSGWNRAIVRTLLLEAMDQLDNDGIDR